MSAVSVTSLVRSYSRGRRAAAFALEPTKRQAAVLAYMREFFAENDQLPPMASIAEHFGWKSANAAQLHVDGLIRIGRLESNEVGKLRFARKKTTQGEPC